MLVAPQKHEYNYEPVLAAPKTNTKTRTELPARAKVCIAVFILCAFAIGLTLTSRVALFTQKGYQETKLKNEIEALQIENERIKLEIDQLSSLDRVEKIATTDLGMTKPSSEDLEFVAVAEPMMMANGGNQSQTQVQVNQTKPSTLAVISQKISSFFVEMVEASEL